VTVKAVIFDWGGTLTPWHTVDHDTLWREVCGPHFPGRADQMAVAIRAAEQSFWQASEESQRSATLTEIFDQAGMTPTEAFLASYFAAINAHDYQQYAGLLSPGRREQLTAADFAQGYGTTTDTAASVVGISATGPAVAATVTFTSRQQSVPGADITGCTRWEITLYLRKHDGTLLIGTPPAAYHAYQSTCR